jgi:hypothetical protein
VMPSPSFSQGTTGTCELGLGRKNGGSGWKLLEIWMYLRFFGGAACASSGSSEGRNGMAMVAPPAPTRNIRRVSR